MSTHIDTKTEIEKVEEDLKLLQEKLEDVTKKRQTFTDACNRELASISNQIIQRKGILQYLSSLKKETKKVKVSKK